MRLFESKKISKLSESYSIPVMNKREYLRNHFFDFPDEQLKSLLKQISEIYSLDCGVDKIERFEVIKSEGLHTKNIGFKVVFFDALNTLPISGILNHKVGEIEFSIWDKNATFKLR